MEKIKLVKPKGCRNPHEGENPLITLARLLSKKKTKKKPLNLKDKVIY